MSFGSLQRRPGYETSHLSLASSEMEPLICLLLLATLLMELVYDSTLLYSAAKRVFTRVVHCLVLLPCVDIRDARGASTYETPGGAAIPHAILDPVSSNQ